MLPIRVISLVRHPRRREQFARRNRHLAFTFFDAIDGSQLTIDQIRASGAFTREVEPTYEAHAYGAALSHRALWVEAAAAAEPLTVAEDDAVFRHDFEARRAEVLASLAAGWDMVLWGWNFDSLLVVRPMGDGSPTVMFFDQPAMRRTLDPFQAQRTAVQPLPLHMAFGLPAYTLSPTGAKRMLELCFPQRPGVVALPLLNKRLANVGVDVSLSFFYGTTQSFACFPPLVVTPNQRGEI